MNEAETWAKLISLYSKRDRERSPLSEGRVGIYSIFLDYSF